MEPLIESFGDRIIRYDVTLIRRWADLEDSKDVKDSIEWDKNPHHQDDVRDFIPASNLYVDAYKVPSRMMHLHQMVIRFNGKAPSKDQIIETFHNEFGVAILNSARGTAQLGKRRWILGFDTAIQIWCISTKRYFEFKTIRSRFRILTTRPAW